MDPLAVSAVVAASGLGARLTATVNRYLRLRWRVRQEHARRLTLEALARALPGGSHLDEEYADGGRLRLTLAQRSQADREAAR